ncbi:MAG: 2-hydroxychromene-2-carboxylate isomerase [Pseudomonadota bacterium]
MAAANLDFYFDYLSHNAYLMWQKMPALVRGSGRELVTKPVLFAGFLKASGQLGPAEIPSKLHWMNRNNLRKAALLGVELRAPVRHPFNPLLLLRVTAAEQDIGRRNEMVGLLLKAVWVDRVDPNDPGALTAYLLSGGFDPSDLFARVDDDQVKARVKDLTDECLARGGFGVPTVLVDDEVFWGFDDLAYLALFLKGEDPIAGLDLQAYEQEWGATREKGAHRAR